MNTFTGKSKLQNLSLNIQGHRGARGLFPENTLTAFIEAVKLGVNTLEMDLVISGDQQVVVSHEAWMNADFCSKSDGSAVEPDSKMKYNLYQMPYAEIKRYDCGKRGNPDFPLQKTMPEHKPLFSDVIIEVEAFIKKNNLNSVAYNIEIKSENGPEIFNPPPKQFVSLVYQEIKKINLENRVNVQSFDVAMLQEMKKTDHKIKLGLLVENKDSLSLNIAGLGFVPDFYSPEFTLVNDLLVKEAHQKNMNVTTWTVNEPAQMKKLILMGVDGIITDYPDRAIALIKNYY